MLNYKFEGGVFCDGLCCHILAQAIADRCSVEFFCGECMWGQVCWILAQLILSILEVGASKFVIAALYCLRLLQLLGVLQRVELLGD